MIRDLQLYTVCIVIIVIGLSIYSYVSSLEVGDDYMPQQTISKSKQAEKGVKPTIKESKYVRPYRELMEAKKNADKNLKMLKKSINEAKGLLDIEKDISKLNNMFE